MLPAKLSPKKLRILPLAAVIFLTVSGGPYGLEPLFDHAGKNASLLLLIITPLLWDVPTIFIVMELNSMMPVTGGYYQWVKKALGMRWAWFEGWWTWLYTFVDLAIYPVLFVEYASFFYPEIAQYKIFVCLAIIWIGAGLNILGIVPVGRTSLILTSLVIVPFLILFILTLTHHQASAHIPSQSFYGMSYSSLGLGLYTVMWNCLGWDNATTYAEEVNKPVKTYLVSTVIAFFLAIALYFMVVMTAYFSGIDFKFLSEEGFPALGEFVGGNWLGVLISVGGMASALGLFSSVLLSVSRVPEAMAEDKLLPKKLYSLHPKYNTPYISIIICAAIVSVMILWEFGELLVIDVTLYGAALFLEYISLIVFRIKMPDVIRPFRIRLNVVGLCILMMLPLTVYIIALSSTLSVSGKMWLPAIFAVCALFSAEIIWRLLVWRNPSLRKNATYSS